MFDFLDTPLKPFDHIHSGVIEIDKEEGRRRKEEMVYRGVGMDATVFPLQE